MDLKTRILDIIEEEWDSARPPGGVGVTHSRRIYARLVDEGVEVPDWKMAQILEELHAYGQIRGQHELDRAGRRIHGARQIIEPEWRP